MMMRKILCGVGALAALSIAPATLPDGKAEARPMFREAVSGCVQLEEVMQLHNTCDFTVQLVYCVENYDCHGGEFSHMFNLGAGGILTLNGDSAYTVHWGACRGSNSITTVGTQAYSWEFRCV